MVGSYVCSTLRRHRTKKGISVHITRPTNAHMFSRWKHVGEQISDKHIIMCICWICYVKWNILFNVQNGTYEVNLEGCLVFLVETRRIDGYEV
jgi:hypothetical protein